MRSKLFYASTLVLAAVLACPPAAEATTPATAVQATARSTAAEAAGPWTAAEAAGSWTGAKAASSWTGAWSTSPQREAGPAFTHQTLRLLIHPTLGGTSLRIRLANTYGEQDVTFGAVGVAHAAAPGTAGLVPGTGRRVTFRGRDTVTVRTGTEVFSDPVRLDVDHGTALAVDLYVTAGGDAAAITGHDAAQGTQFVAAGDRVGGPAEPFAGSLTSWYWLDGVDVRATRDTRGSIVALGDSITDGAYTTWNGADRWTDDLAARLDGRFGVLNQGIGGNQVLTDRTDCCGQGTSVSALTRERADVLAQTRVKYVIIADGINDIGYQASADALIAGITTLARRARHAGIEVIGATITPYGCEAGCFTPEQEATRQAVNAWIRTSPLFTGVADFDAAVRDPADPAQVLPAYQADHLHPNIAGQRAMANAMDLTLFR
jgi:lysophospholipase L1-like esterase